MSNIFKIILLLSFISCSFKSKDLDENKSFEEALFESHDFDGDLISNQDEEELGRNPFVADIPQLTVNYSNSIKIELSYLDLKTGESELVEYISNNDEVNNDIKSVPFIKLQSLEVAASIGKFSTHSWGEIDSEKLYWMTRKKTKRRSLQRFLLLYGHLFNTEEFEITNVSLSFKNWITLEEGEAYSEVSNIDTIYRMYNFKADDYEVIHKNRLNRVVVSGVKEKFDVKIEGVNPDVFYYNLLNGERLIVHEILNYDLPEIQTKYLNLISSIRSKTVPILINTPLSSRVFYSSLSRGATFNSILTNIFHKNFKIENEQLLSIDQFKNSLPKFTYLNELKELDKVGNWFVLTDNISKHYLKYNYSQNDIISISYILGDELSSQKRNSHSSQFLSTNSIDTRIHSLGSVTHNSSVEFKILPENIYGDRLKTWVDVFTNQSCNGRRNCMSFPFRCDASFNIFNSISLPLVLTENTVSELRRIDLVIEGFSYNIGNLLSEGKLEVLWDSGMPSFYIKDISEVHSIKDLKEASLNLKLKSKREVTFNGVKLTNMSGQASYNCPGIVANIAGSNGWPLSVDSHKFSEWANVVNWSLVKRGESKEIKEDFSLSFSGTIINFYN